jgi:hypothetical protein
MELESAFLKGWGWSMWLICQPGSCLMYVGDISTIFKIQPPQHVVWPHQKGEPENTAIIGACFGIFKIFWSDQIQE